MIINRPTDKVMDTIASILEVEKSTLYHIRRGIAARGGCGNKGRGRSARLSVSDVCIILVIIVLYRGGHTIVDACRRLHEYGSLIDGVVDAIVDGQELDAVVAHGPIVSRVSIPACCFQALARELGIQVYFGGDA